MTTYAIQLADFMWLRQHEPALGIVLAANAERASIQIGRERFDDDALPLACPAEQAEALVAVIRGRFGRDQIRIWRNDTGNKSGWKRV